MSGETKFEKLFYSLDEISRKAKLDKKIIEKWEKEFYFLHAGQTASGQKFFRKRDLDIILRLKDLLESQKVTLAGAKRIIENEFGVKGSPLAHPDHLKKILIQIREQLQELASQLQKH